MTDAIVARGVRVHNLKGIDVTIPLGRLVVVTGVSGSGKSSLAFDTLYAEGQRRYVESLSVYARQFLDRLPRPEVDSLEGLCPAIAIRQRTPSRNPRSTVATATEVHDYLRVLFARVGGTVCSCGQEVAAQTAQSAADRLLELPEGSRLLLAFPLDLNGHSPAELRARLLRQGYRRLLVGQDVVDLETTPADAALPAEACVLVDRLVLGGDIRARLTDSLEAALAAGGGRAEAQVADGPRLRLTERLECRACGRTFAPPDPRLFSFNNPRGACLSCHGFGNLVEIDEALVFPDPDRTLAEGAVEPWQRPRYRAARSQLRRFARRQGIPLTVPWSQLPDDQRRMVLEGDGDFGGVAGFFRWLETKKYRVQVRAFLGRYRSYRTCPSCDGSRLRPEARAVRVAGRGIDDLCRLSVADALAFVEGLRLSNAQEQVAGGIRHELARRLGFLDDVGLAYLTLDRAFGSLSGGEAQRIALAAALGTGLVGTLYVLDEPSVGLHPRDTDRLVGVLRGLRDQGNTVVIVEHERGVIGVADHVLDLGPGAGEQGGRLVFQGSRAELLRDGRSLTAKYLRGELQLAVPLRRRRGNGLALGVRGARARNLKNLDVRIPLGALTCVTGVSGSGKSTLVHDVLCAALLRKRGRWERAVGEHDAIDGAGYLDDVVLVDQSPIGRSPRSNPVTYLKAFDGIREVFAATADARRRGLEASDFSFNVDGGRCPACAGDGQVKVDLQFLPDVYLPCESCHGRRYRAAVLEVRHRGRTIYDVLEMTVHEALHFFSSQPKVSRRLKLFEQIGLGYLRLGQPATTLSGGEAQRLKLAAHLVRRVGQRVLYVLDEPTTGLHPADIQELLRCFDRLLEAGGSLVVIEHNMDVVKQADWVIDLGPDAGPDGGRLVFQGTPEELAARDRGATSRYLRSALDGGSFAANQRT